MTRYIIRYINQDLGRSEYLTDNGHFDFDISKARIFNDPLKAIRKTAKLGKGFAVRALITIREIG